MIITGIINVLASFFRFLLNPIESISWIDFNSELGHTFMTFLNIVKYFFPIEYISPLISIVIGIVSYKIIIAILKTIWQVLPIV